MRPVLRPKLIVKQSIDRQWLKDELREVKEAKQSNPELPKPRWSADNFRVTASLLIEALIRVSGPRVSQSISSNNVKLTRYGSVDGDTVYRVK